MDAEAKRTRSQQSLPTLLPSISGNMNQSYVGPPFPPLGSPFPPSHPSKMWGRTSVPSSIEINEVTVVSAKQNTSQTTKITSATAKINTRVSTPQQLTAARNFLVACTHGSLSSHYKAYVSLVDTLPIGNTLSASELNASDFTEAFGTEAGSRKTGNSSAPELVFGSVATQSSDKALRPPITDEHQKRYRIQHEKVWNDSFHIPFIGSYITNNTLVRTDTMEYELEATLFNNLEMRNAVSSKLFYIFNDVLNDINHPDFNGVMRNKLSTLVDTARTNPSPSKVEDVSNEYTQLLFMAKCAFPNMDAGFSLIEDCRAALYDQYGADYYLQCGDVLSNLHLDPTKTWQENWLHIKKLITDNLSNQPICGVTGYFLNEHAWTHRHAAISFLCIVEAHFHGFTPTGTVDRTWYESDWLAKVNKDPSQAPEILAEMLSKINATDRPDSKAFKKSKTPNHSNNSNRTPNEQAMQAATSSNKRQSSSTPGYTPSKKPARTTSTSELTKYEEKLEGFNAALAVIERLGPTHKGKPSQLLCAVISQSADISGWFECPPNSKVPYAHPSGIPKLKKGVARWDNPCRPSTASCSSNSTPRYENATGYVRGFLHALRLLMSGDQHYTNWKPPFAPDFSPSTIFNNVYKDCVKAKVVLKETKKTK
jgi:hypothetical protein